MQKACSKGIYKVNMFPPCIDEHHSPVYVVPNCYGRAWAVWRQSFPQGLRDISAVLQWAVLIACLTLRSSSCTGVTPAMLWCLALGYRMCSKYNTHFRILLLSHSRLVENGVYVRDTLGGASMANVVPLSKACGTRVRRAKRVDTRGTCLRLQDGISTLVPLSV